MQRLLFGTDEAIPAERVLRAGRFEAHLRGTRLGPVRFAGHEVWHGIDFLYRDPDWGTPGAVIDHCDESALDGGLRVVLRGRVPSGPGVAFEILIEAREHELRYEVTFTAQEDLPTQRTGLVVMHPLAVCGRRVEVEHTDGRMSASTFPTLIAAWPPFTLVRAVRHEVADGGWATCRFAGDDFELEDQRNNADASFKTYSRSNLMPRPYTLRGGHVQRQGVLATVDAPPAAPAVRAARPVRVRAGNDAGAAPAVGTAIGPADLRPPQAVAAALGDLAPSLLHLVLDHPEEPFDAHALAGLLHAAGDCALRLDVGGLEGRRAGTLLEPLAGRLHRAGVAPAAVAAFPSTPPVLDAARRAFPAALVGGGSPYFYTQLNRIEDLGRVDFLTFTTAAVVHGADDDEVMAGLRSLPAMARTLRSRHGDLPVHVGPSSIGARRSPLGAQPGSDGSRRTALARRDPRTRGLFGAAWAVGQVAQWARAGIHALTLFDLQGDAALVADGVPTPAFEVLRHLGARSRCRAIHVPEDAPLAALALQRSGAARMLLANLGAQPLDVVLDTGALAGHALVMDGAALLHREQHPGAPAWRSVAIEQGALTLGPYAVALV